MTFANHIRRVLIGASLVCATRAGLAGASMPRVVTSRLGASASAVDRAADSLYYAGREALARRDYHGAADLFDRVVEQYPKADVAGKAQYWRGYSLYVSGNVTHSLADLRGAKAALDAEEQRYTDASTAREGLDLRARVVAAEATFGDAGATSALGGAEAALAQPLSCDDRDLALKLVALERVIDRDPEAAMRTIQRVLSTQGLCMEDVRRTAIVAVANTPGMNATQVMNDLARADRSLELMPVALPPIRPLGATVAVSKETISSISQIHALSDGRVLVNDGRGRRLVLFDSSLAHLTVVAANSGGAAGFYLNGGFPPGHLFPFRGDSSLFTDAAGQKLVVIDANGAQRRTMPLPLGPAGQTGYLLGSRVEFDRVSSLLWLTSARDSSAAMGLNIGLDGRLTWRGHIPSLPVGKQADTVFKAGGSAILRFHIVPAGIDTVVTGLRAAHAREVAPYPGIPTCLALTELTVPLSVTDDWTVLSDGTIAIIRASDYHVDWISPDGRKISSPPIQHAWERLTDSMKAAIVDSVRLADSVTDDRNRTLEGLPPLATAWHESEARAAAMCGRQVGPATTIRAYPPHYTAPNRLPDSLPPFVVPDTVGARVVMTDADDDIWIHAAQTKPPAGGQVFDVVNRGGRLIDRVQIPAGATIAGFGRGVVYLARRDGETYRLERARIR